MPRYTGNTTTTYILLMYVLNFKIQSHIQRGGKYMYLVDICQLESIYIRQRPNKKAK
jgi:hypothetical protein